MQIGEEADLRVYVPSTVPSRRIEEFLHEREDWVIKHLHEAGLRKQKRQRHYEDGETFPYLGKWYPLRLEAASRKTARIEFAGSGWKILLSADMKSQRRKDVVRSKLTEWYKGQARELVAGRIFYYARLIGVEPLKLAVRTQKRMWGCCHIRTRTIIINWQLIGAPLRVVDYVLIHELCHLIHPNHSARFWKKVEFHMPDYRIHKTWLRDHQDAYKIA